MKRKRFYKCVFNKTGVNNNVLMALEKEFKEKLLKNKEDYDKSLSVEVEKIREDIYNEIGRELHDNLNQLLSTIRLYLELIVKEGHFDPELLHQCSGFVLQSIEEVRKLSRQYLSPLALDMEFCESIRYLTDIIVEASGIRIELSMKNCESERIKQQFQVNIYRIIQEKLNNILKHAAASLVIIEIFTNDTELTLSVKDNGKGFDTLKAKKGMGLKNILHRVKLCNGEFYLSSSPGKGCKTSVRIPLT